MLHFHSVEMTRNLRSQFFGEKLQFFRQSELNMSMSSFYYTKPLQGNAYTEFSRKFAPGFSIDTNRGGFGLPFGRLTVNSFSEYCTKQQQQCLGIALLQYSIMQQFKSIALLRNSIAIDLQQYVILISQQNGKRFHLFCHRLL